VSVLAVQEGGTTIINGSFSAVAEVDSAAEMGSKQPSSFAPHFSRSEWNAYFPKAAVPHLS